MALILGIWCAFLELELCISLILDNFLPNFEERRKIGPVKEGPFKVWGSMHLAGYVALGIVVSVEHKDQMIRPLPMVLLKQENF